MSLATVFSRATVGVNAPLVKIEVHISNGLPSFQVVGLPDTSVRESRDRVRSAIINSKLQFPQSRLTVNLSPADIPKEGARYDLAIAIGILAASEQLPNKALEQLELIGELGLSGDLRPVSAAIPAAIAVSQANRQLILPLDSAKQALVVGKHCILAAQCLLDVFLHLTGKSKLSTIDPQQQRGNTEISQPDPLCLSDVIGQHQSKRALEIAAAGQHNLLLMGAPGTGKSMLAARLNSIQPELTEQEALEVAAINSIANKSFDLACWRKRPFRSPHHTVSGAALVGGGSIPKPGEVTLSQHGVLFLDELPEFSRHVLDVLREPMETGTVTISRAAQQAEFPAQFQLVVALNPSPTGHYNDGRATTDQVLKYLSKISGPLLDRIELQVEMANVKPSQLVAENTQEETSSSIKLRVELARQRMLNRAGKANGLLTSKEVQHHCRLTPEQRLFFQTNIEKLKLSARSYHKLLKVARTIADLAGAEQITQQHIAEALNYRAMDRLLTYLSQN